jgi:hypothetical protein
MHEVCTLLFKTYSAKEAKKQKDNVRNRGVYFCIGYSTFCPRPLHLVLKALKDKHQHDLRLLRISMSHHRFPNMRDIFQSQLSAKMIEKVESLDFKTRDCNCRSPLKYCPCGNICRVPVVVVYMKSRSARPPGKIHIGNTEMFFKASMMGHFQDIKQHVEKKVLSNSHVKHFSGMVPQGTQAPTPGNHAQRDLLVSCSVIWKGDPITALKTFGKHSV